MTAGDFQAPFIFLDYVVEINKEILLCFPYKRRFSRLNYLLKLIILKLCSNAQNKMYLCMVNKKLRNTKKIIWNWKIQKSRTSYLIWTISGSVVLNWSGLPTCQQKKFVDWTRTVFDILLWCFMNALIKIYILH